MVRLKRVAKHTPAVVIRRRRVDGRFAQRESQRADALLVPVRQADPLQVLHAVQRDVHRLRVHRFFVLALVHALLEPPPHVVHQFLRLIVVVPVVPAVHVAHRRRKRRVVAEIGEVGGRDERAELIFAQRAPPQSRAVVVVHEQLRAPRRLLELRGVAEHPERHERSIGVAVEPVSLHVRPHHRLQRLPLMTGRQRARRPRRRRAVLQRLGKPRERRGVVHEHGGQERGGAGAQDLRLPEVGVEQRILRARALHQRSLVGALREQGHQVQNQRRATRLLDVEVHGERRSFDAVRRGTDSLGRLPQPAEPRRSRRGGVGGDESGREGDRGDDRRDARDEEQRARDAVHQVAAVPGAHPEERLVAKQRRRVVAHGGSPHPTRDPDVRLPTLANAPRSKAPTPLPGRRAPPIPREHLAPRVRDERSAPTRRASPQVTLGRGRGG